MTMHSEELAAKTETQALAIIGLAGIFPDAANADQFWQNLATGREARREVPPDRWPLDRFYEAQPGRPGKTYSRWGSFLADIDGFDAAFFGIPPEEAAKMDPQQRLALQQAWHALEDAGYPPVKLAGQSVGVFVGARNGDYHTHLLDNYEQVDPHLMMGQDTALLSARIAYHLDLHGPTLTVNAACASAGVALHLAGQSLRQGECQVALVGGAYVMTTPQRFLMHSRAGLLSPGGHCRVFDDRADGMTLGEAVGFVVLKPLAQALADGDQIYACLKATGLNQNGHSPGITRPDPKAQAQLMKAVLHQAGVKPDSISYIETHGTGTRKGDAWELAALQEAYGSPDGQKPVCAIGSVKTNVGHTITAALIPSLFKVLLSFKHRQLPPSLNFSQPNRLFNFENSPFYVNTQLQSWRPPAAQPRRAAISCFAYTGTNFHMILEEPPAAAPEPREQNFVPYLFPLSAKTEAALARQGQQLHDWLEKPEAGERLGDVAYTLALGRTHFEQRVAFVARSAPELQAQLKAYLATGRLHYPPDKEMAGLVKQARRYQTGAALDEAGLWAGRSYRRRSLPVYPFARERYWLPPLPGQTRETPSEAVTRHLLLLSRRDEVYQALKLRNDPTLSLTLLKPGPGYRQLGPDIYQVDPADPEDYLALLKALAPRLKGTLHVVNLWPHDGELLDYIYPDEIERCIGLMQANLTFSARAVQALAQAAGQFTEELKIRFYAIHYGQGSQTQPHQHLAAACLPSRETLSLRTIALAERLHDPQALARLIQSELDEIGEALWVQYTPELKREERMAGPPVLPLNLREEGTYLVVDRQGEAGVVLARLLLRRHPQTRCLLMTAQSQIVDDRVQFLNYPEGSVIEPPPADLRGVIYIQQAGAGLDWPAQLAELLRLDATTRNLSLDFFVILSLGLSPAQHQVAEALVALRQALGELGRRSGLSLALAWPDADLPAQLEQTLEKRLFPMRNVLPSLLPQVEPDLVNIVADTLRINRNQIDLDAPLDGLLFNSLTITELAQRLSRHYRLQVNPVLFFEHQSLRALFNEFTRTYGAELSEYYEAGAEVVPPPQPAAKPVETRQMEPCRPFSSPAEPVAIIGLAGILPGSNDLEEFWAHLEAGDELIREIPPERWDWRQYDGEPTEPGKTPSRWGGLIDGVDQFDAAFFGISPREAELMDPQQRLFLEVVWQTLEQAGYKAGDLAGSDTGVFVGVSTIDYNVLLNKHQPHPEPHWFTGNMRAILANRVSFFFDWHGPSEPVDTACSSALVAVQRAVTALQTGQCSLAVAGGVNLLLSPAPQIAFSQAGMLSPAGHCYTFEARANGYVRGEGAGAVLLKPLALAERDGDTIYGVIKGSAVNHGGRVSSLTVPNPKAQAALLVAAYRQAGIDPKTVTFIETHGTGTSLGDPIEVEGLRRAFAELYAAWGHPPPHEPHCSLGAVKTNIGHLEAAAGIAGLLKVLLAMHHGKIPATLHLETPNPHLNLAGSPFTLSPRRQSWPRLKDEAGREIPRRAGVSAFGFGGANAHLVLEEYLPLQSNVLPVTELGTTHLFLLSAKNEAQLKCYAERWLSFLEGRLPHQLPASLAEVSYTLQLGREAMPTRLALEVSSFAELRHKLAHFCREESLPERSWTGWVSPEPSPTARLLAGPAGEGFLDTLYQQPDLEKLAQLWLAGVAVDWSRLYPRPLARVSLPTYPFARQRYWFTAGAGPELGPQPSEAFEQIEQFGATGVLRTFQQMGVFQQAGESYDPIPLQHQLGILDRYQPLYQALLTILETHGCLIRQGQRLTVAPQVMAWHDDPAGERERLLAQFPDYGAYLRFLEGCLNRYPLILTGQIPPLEALFPGGDTGPVEAVYRQNPAAPRLNEILAEALARLVGEKLAAQPGQTLRILEVGAGTGSSSLPVLERLHAHAASIEYWFTDVSPAFVNTAAEKWGSRYPFVRFKRLDIQAERPEAIPPMDLILATNVLHATRNVAQTLKNVSRLLKPGGHLLLSEITKLTSFTTLTFGLSEAWWAVGDPERRLSGSPLLSLAGWQALLAEQGFTELAELGGSHEADPLGQVLLLAQESGDAARPPLDLSAALLAYLQALFQQVTKVPLAELNPERTYEAFGVDSLLNLQLLGLLEKDFGPLPKVLLYRENTLARLAHYLLQEHRAAVTQKFHSQAAGTLPPPEEISPTGSPQHAMPTQLSCQIPDPSPQPDTAEIAIIGLAGRYPQAETLAEFWQNLRAGQDSVTEIPPSRWDYRRYPYREEGREITYPWGSFLEDIDQFDPRLFGIAPKEAPAMDPHERLFLQTAWSVFEDAGYSRSQLLQNERNPVGVFVGVTYNNYQLLAAEQWACGHLSAFSSQLASIANRVSYHFNLSGPSLTLDTACASSLTAIHLACESLRRGECEAALAGGVNLSLHPSKYYSLLAGGYLSPTGRCRTFSDEADGMVPGEGVGAVLLKPLSRALADGDQIYAVIKGSACNHGGKVSGYTVPNPRAQAELIQTALDRAGINPRTISYVEAHGTGTPLGDPIEVMGLTEAYRAYTADEGFCAIGSVKSNLGHLEAAAGIAQLTKVLLQLKHKTLVPSLHVRQSNPKIDFEHSPFVVQTALQPWVRPVIHEEGQPREHPRRAAISSFGAGGVNAHLIVEEYEVEAANSSTPGPHLIVLSAQSPAQLKASARRLHHYAETEAALDLRAVAYTLQTGREAMPHRLAVIAHDRPTLLSRLAGYLDDQPASGWIDGEAREIGPALASPGRLSPEALAQAWVRGATVAWPHLYAEPRPRKLSLPTYPFAREAYWVPEPPTPSAPKKEVEISTPTVEPARPQTIKAEPAEALAGWLTRLVGELLGLAVTQIEPQLGFAQMGMESMHALRLKRTLEQHLQLSLPDTLAFEHPNVAALTAYLRSLLEDNRPPALENETENPNGAEADELECLSLPEISELLEAELSELEAQK